MERIGSFVNRVQPFSNQQPQTAAAGASHKDLSPQAPVDGLVDISRQPETSAELFERLSNFGGGVGRQAAERFEGSLKAGYESLMKFQGPQGAVISLKSVEDLRNYVALVSDGSCSDQKLTAAAKVLTDRLGDGIQLFFERSNGGKKDLLKSDAAGASIQLSRGEQLLWVAQDGSQGKLKNLTDVSALPTRNPKTAELGAALDSLEAAGYTLTPAPREAKPNESFLQKLERLAASAPKGLELRKKLFEQLDSGKLISVKLANDSRKLQLPIGVDGQQLLALSQYQSSPTAEQTRFKASFEKLQKDGTVFTARALSGDEKGMLLNASDRSALLNLVAGVEVVALTKDGQLHSARSLEDISTLESTGSIPSKLVSELPLGTNPTSDNLFMAYYAAPFDPVNVGNYDDLPLRLSQVGSSTQVDIVTLHSDLPNKKTLHLDRVHKGQLEQLQQMDPKIILSDPKVFEDFIYHTISDNLSDKHIRLLVVGHGRAEKGLVPDGKDNNAQADNSMNVDDFSKSITQALDRVEKDTGKRPHIDNLVLCSCLMGNSSLIHALSQNSDVGFLCASPEIMNGSSPVSMVEFLNDPKHSQASAEEFARFLVDDIMETPVSPGGSPATHHADTYGAYSLDKAKGARFQKSLADFFQVCLAHPEDASSIKQAIIACPTYGQNRGSLLNNVMTNVQQRDIIQVAERIANDARVKSADVKSACKELIEATSDQVLVQRVTKDYEGRRGPTLNLPVDRFDFDAKFSETELLKSTRYNDFLNLIFDAKVYRDVEDSFVARLHQLNDMANRLAPTTSPAAAAPLVALKDTTAAESKTGSDCSVQPQPVPVVEEAKATQAPEVPADPLAPQKAELLGLIGKVAMLNTPIQQAHAFEQPLKVSEVANLRRKTVSALRTTAVLGGALACGLVGSIPGAVLGLLLGTKSGITGHSVSSDSFGGEATTTVVTQAELAAEAKKLQQSKNWARLSGPAELVGIRTNRAVGYKWGEVSGRVAGALAGSLGGVLGGAWVGLREGTQRGARWLNANFFPPLPSPQPEKNHPKGNPEADPLIARVKELLAELEPPKTEAAQTAADTAYRGVSSGGSSAVG